MTGGCRERIRRFGAGLLCLVLFTLATARGAFGAEPAMLPTDIQAKLFLTALTYVNNLSKGEEQEIEIGFVYFPDTGRSRQQAAELINAFDVYKDKTVGGRTIKTVLIEYQGREALREAISRQGIEALYVAPGTPAACAEVTRVTRELKVLTLTADKQQLADCGLSLSIAPDQGKPRVYLNQQSAQAEGMEISSKLQRIAVLVSKKQ